MEQIRRTAAEALDVFDAVMVSVQGDDRSRLSGPERVALMQRARRFRDRVSSWACVLTAEADLVALSATGTPLTSLIGMDEGRDSGDAAREVFQARDLNKHASIKDAAINGEVSPRHAAAITKGLGKLPEDLTSEQKSAAEEAFIRRAPKNTPRRLAELADEVLAEVAPEHARDTDDDAVLEAQRRKARAKRHLKWGDDGEGSIWFRGSLPHLEAASLTATIEAWVESDRRAEKDRLKATRATHPNQRTLQGQASDDLTRTPDQRRADALVELIAAHRGAPTTMGDRPRIVVTIREHDLRDKAEKAGVLPRGAKITAGELRRLSCDADIMPVVLGSESEILDVGRTQRLVTPAIRKALTLRDKGCIFPGCTTSDSACEAHHLQPWWAGGATALHNLVLLCRHHHGLVEPDRYRRPGDQWHIHINPDTGTPIITPPGRTQRFTGREPPENPLADSAGASSHTSGSSPTKQGEHPLLL